MYKLAINTGFCINMYMILFSISSLFFLNINRNLTDDSNVTTHTLVVEYVVKLFIVIVLEKAAIGTFKTFP